MRIFALISMLVLWTGVCAAETPAQMLAADEKVVIRFQPAGTRVPDGMLVNDGSVYSAEKGLGWDQDLRSQGRDRGDGCTGVALLDRGVTTAAFNVTLPDGDYLFEVTAWDTGFTTGITPLIDGEAALGSMRLRSGEKGMMTIPVTARDGKASVVLTGGISAYPNCMVHEIVIIPASAQPDRFRLVSSTVQTYLTNIEKTRIDQEEKHSRQRAAYRAVVVEDEKTPRQTIDLTGDWLFRPSQDAGTGADPITMDANWHVLGVPQFWNPTEWWIYTTANGTSHNYIRKEIQRCEDFTFDYKTTESGWYRQWIKVPSSMKGRRLVLRFDAVASFAEVYWNGRKVGSHVGMFGPFECEVTDEVRFGELNLLAVMVGSSKTDPSFAKDSVGVAVTVNITKDMLNSLPHGWFKNGMAGIWQPVSLEVTGKGRIDDVYFQPFLDGALIETHTSGLLLKDVEVRHTIVDAATGRTLVTGNAREYSGLSEDGKVQKDALFRNLNPKLWSPEHPNLYRLRTQLFANGVIFDEKTITVGFKTFKAKGNRLYLNGKPYYIRGADMPPHGLMPNDKALADKFMKLMHDGNEMATRFHMCPPSKIWMDAADKQGVGTSVGETWPWVLMGDTPIPDPKLMEVWKNEFREVVKANRNHPSLMLWTISNESYFEGGRDPDKNRQTEKYRWFSDVIKAAREADPKTPVVLHSGYVRNQGDYDTLLTPNKLDDGDVDDKHAYFGWYSTSPFQFDYQKSIEASVSKTRPLISQEASTGYPDNDTGHPVESYMRDHVVPQAWVGKYGTFEERPDMFLDIHGQITKEYAEKVRRDRTDLSGWMLFANCCWFKDVYDAETIAPYPAYYGVQLAHQPVLVSLALHDRHFEAGRTFIGEVVVVNDDPDRPEVKDLTLRWHIFGKGPDWGTSGSVPFPGCAYDGKGRQSVEFTMPSRLYTERAPMTLELTLLQGDEVISRNEYPLICATQDWYSQGGGTIYTLDADARTSDYLKDLGYECHDVGDELGTLIGRGSVIVAGPNDHAQRIGTYLKGGANVLMIQPDAETIKSVTGQEWKVIDTSGDFVDVLAPDLLTGMDPMDMHWWNASPGGLVRVCGKGYQMPDAPGLTKLAQHIQPHSYLRQGKEQIARYTSWPVVELEVGRGRLIISSMLLAEDPIAKRFTTDLVNHLMK